MSEQAQNLNENEELVEEVQQETTSTEDPLEEAIARVQELEEQLKAQVEETSKKEQDRAHATPANKEDENIKALFDGVELTLKELLSTVSRFGVEPVGAVGDTFNPDLHQAISMQPAEGFTTNQITTVLQKGYTLNGRVIRPAMVMVAA